MESMVNSMLDFYKGKKVFVTGHTGFKGTWLCKILIEAGALVTGYALKPPAGENLFDLSGISSRMNSIIGDVRDLESLHKAFNEANPTIAIHLAAQPLVRDSYLNPHYTYETNVMGTVNFLECVRLSKTVKSVLNVTTDKVYKNQEWEWGYREDESLNGFDPYSNSKSCSDILTQSYINSFFLDSNVSISIARAGNVIGGGDFAKDRIIPDCVRAAQTNKPIWIRNPYSVRPYQHVLEPLFFYLLVLEKQFNDKKYAGYYNVGPNDTDSITTSELVDIFCVKWENGLTWINKSDDGPHESNYLKLDCSKATKIFNWKPRWDIDKAIEMTIEWTKEYLNNRDISVTMNNQIRKYIMTANNSNEKRIIKKSKN